MSPLTEFSCPKCHAAKRLRGARVFAWRTCAGCGAEWRAREEIGGWQLHELLARSGYALIFHAVDPAGGESVALKIFGLPECCTPEDARRFTDDVTILAASDHPHWLRVFAGGVEGEVAWLAMEWLPGGSLAQCGRMNEAEALWVAAQIADALVAAHAAGLRHRNLQIGECFFDAAGAVKVSGFAESIFYMRAGEEVGTAWGRLSCAPPERVFGDVQDSRSEIYALGAILFQMLTGGLPHEGETVPELMMDRLDGAALRVADFVSGVRISTAAIVDRMLAIDPRQRFSSWEETAAVLRNELAVLGRSQSAAPAIRRVVKARPAVQAPVYSPTGGAWFTILMLAAIAGVGGWFGWSHFHKPDAEKMVTAATPAPPPASEPEQIAAPPPEPSALPELPAPVVAEILTPAPDAPSPAPEPSLPKMDWGAWEEFLLESPKRRGTGKGEHHFIRGSGALRLRGNNTGLAGGDDENVFFARQLAGDWTLTVRVSANDGPAGIVAREGIGSERPCVGLFLGADGKLNAALREQPTAKLAPTPVTAAAGTRWLRIVRLGAAIDTFHSADGERWHKAVTLNLPSLPERVPVGFVVWSGDAAKMAGATFDEVTFIEGR